MGQPKRLTGPPNGQLIRVNDPGPRTDVGFQLWTDADSGVIFPTVYSSLLGGTACIVNEIKQRESRIVTQSAQSI